MSPSSCRAKPPVCWDTLLSVPQGFVFHGLAPFPWDMGAGTDAKLVAGAGVEAPEDLGGLGAAFSVDPLVLAGGPHLLQLHDGLGDAPSWVLRDLPGESDGGVRHGLC